MKKSKKGSDEEEMGIELAFKPLWLIIGAVIYFSVYFFPEMLAARGKRWFIVNTFIISAITFLLYYFSIGRFALFSIVDLIWWFVGTLLLASPFFMIFQKITVAKLVGEENFALSRFESLEKEVKKLCQEEKESLRKVYKMGEITPLLYPLLITMLLGIFILCVRWTGIIPYSNSLTLFIAVIVPLFVFFGDGLFCEIKIRSLFDSFPVVLKEIGILQKNSKEVLASRLLLITLVVMSLSFIIIFFRYGKEIVELEVLIFLLVCIFVILSLNTLLLGAKGFWLALLSIFYLVPFMTLVLFIPHFIGDESYKAFIMWLGLPGLPIVLGHILLFVIPIQMENVRIFYGFTFFLPAISFIFLSPFTLALGSIGLWISLGLIVLIILFIGLPFLLKKKTSGVVAPLLLSLFVLFVVVKEGAPRLLSQKSLNQVENFILSGDYSKANELIQNAVTKIRPYQEIIDTLHLPEFLAVVPHTRLLLVHGLSVQVAIASGNYSRAMENIQLIEAKGWLHTSKRTAIESCILKTQIYQALGDRVKEEEMINNAWQIANKTFNRPYWTAHVNRYRARLEMERGNYDEAIKILKDVEKVGKRIGSYRLLISGIGGMGDVYAKQGKYPDAERFYSDALKLSQKYKAKGDEAQYLLRLAMAQKQTGNMQTSSINLSQAITITREISAHEILWQGYYQMGLLLEGQGKKEEAFKNYADAINVIETIRGSLKKEEQRLGYAAGKMPVYERIVSLLHQSGKKGEAFSYTQKGKSRALLDLLGTRMVAYRDEDKKLAEREQLLQTKVNALLERVGEEESKPERLQSGKLKGWKEELQKTLKEHSDVLTEIKRTNPQLASLTTVPTVKISDVQNVLRPDEAFLEYFVTNEKILLYAITKSEVRVFEISLTRAKLNKMVSEVYQPMTSNNPLSVSVLYRAYTTLLDPALRYFVTKRQLIIAPHDKLYLLPFEALVVSPATPTYLVDRYFVSYYPSASVLVLNRKYQEKKPLPSKPLFAVGDPVFNSDDPRYPSLDKNKIKVALAGKERGSLSRRVMMDDAIKPISEKTKVQVVLGRLSATGMEVKGITSILGVPEGGVDVKIGLNATEKEVKKIDHTKYKYEHYATHGVLRGDIPGLKEPALVFSLPNPDDPVTDEGFLTMSEIFGLRTNADMVVLSACSTALGEDIPGEGLIGLTRAFMYAGTPSVVASLWNVADESTAKLMVAYYRYLKQGMDKAEALTLAKRELMRQGYYRPHYWAPFILVGER